MTSLLDGLSLQLDNAPTHCGYGAALLRSLGVTVAAQQATPLTHHPAELWAASGLMDLTGLPDGAPQLCPVPLPSCALSTLGVFRSLVGREILPGFNGARLLSERASFTGMHRNGSRSLAGHCRLLATADGTIGVNLPRPTDWDLVPAWLEIGETPDWEALATELVHKPARLLVARARLLGLAVVDANPVLGQQDTWMEIPYSVPAGTRQNASPRVVDLSSLWAGPLCSKLWQAAGAEVIKVESTRRPDGARRGNREYFDLLNMGKSNLRLDLDDASGLRALRELIDSADIVLEASRPRALQQMGIIAEEIIDAHPGLTWVSITGYGRQEPQANWIAYGDDAGIAAGLSAILHHTTGQWLICGDAIADPLSGLHAAVAGWAGFLSGGGKLIDVSLARTVQFCITQTAPDDNDYRARQIKWNRHLAANHIAALPPRPARETLL